MCNFFNKEKNEEKDRLGMRKHVKLVLCGLAVAVLAAGCSKKDDTAKETTVATESDSSASTEEIKDKGEVKKLGQYKGVEVTRESTEVTDEEVDQRIQSILDANPEYVEITDRPAQNGDTVDIDYVGMKDGVAFDGGTAQGYKLELGSGTFIDGFEDGLVGASVGQELSLNLTFPEDYGNTDLAGQAVVFDVTVNGIEEKKDAVLDDNFVQRVSDLKTVDEFRADTLADLKDQKEQEADQQVEEDAFMAALNDSEFDLNEAAVDQQYNNQLNYYESMMQAYGMTLENYASLYGMTEDDFKTELRNAAENAIKQQLMAEAIAEKEGLEVEDADREALANQYGMDVETLKQSYGEEAVDQTAMMYKVIDFIKDNAVVK